MILDPKVERYLPLDDISIRSEGSGRIVDAYAAVFGTRQEITDNEGHYFETLSPQAFDRTIAQRAGKFKVFFNHGKTLHGTPSERYSMPLGRSLEVRADERGVFTSTEYAATPLGDEVLELVRSGTITGMSFSGSWVKSRDLGTHDGLRSVERTEVALREYGPTPFPSYEDAAVVGVRNEILALAPSELAEHLAALEPQDRALIVRALQADPDTGTDDDADPVHAALRAINPASAYLLTERINNILRGH